MRSVDNIMSRLCNRLMSSEQQALDTLSYALEEMEYLLEQNPDREDIKACIDEIKTKVKADESEHWVICNNWSEHFDGITQGDPDEEKTEKADGDSPAEA